METLDRSFEELNAKFSAWLNDQMPSNFSDINGYEILKAFSNEGLVSIQISDKFDYKNFIRDKRELIKSIEVWISNFELSLEDYEVYFKLFSKEYLNSKEQNPSFESARDRFTAQIIQPNFIIEKSALRVNRLKDIYAKEKYNEEEQKKELRFLAHQNKKKDLLKECPIHKAKSKKPESTIHRQPTNPKSRNERESKQPFSETEFHHNVLVCSKCKTELSTETISLDKIRRYGRLCEKCLAIKRSNYKRGYKERFPDKIRLEKKQYKKKRLDTDISFKILTRLRNRMLMVLQGKRKHKCSLKLLGCSPEFLIIYLESKFQEGMNWDNYGIRGWHIDHVRPCSSFDLTDEQEQEKCFHYSNLQPLWWQDNLLKSDKW